MPSTLLLAAHGTRSPSGTATTHRLVETIAAARPDTEVALSFLDVAEPSLADALDALRDRDVVVVPLLLSSGYHVRVDIPAIVDAFARVRVARHLGPDPLVIDALAERLEGAGGGGPVLLAAIASTQSAAREEVEQAASLLANLVQQDVAVLPLSSTLGALPAPARFAVYLLAEGGFLENLRSAVGDSGSVAEPIGVHPALVELVWSRYDEAVRAVG